MPRVVTDSLRTEMGIVDQLARYGVATIHEALGRKGLLHHRLRPIFGPVRIAGNAVTCEVYPGDNWTIHVAVEQCQVGDILVVSPTSFCDDGYFGELLATSLQSRGVRGLVIDAGVRDVLDLKAMNFPVWSRCVNAQGTVKEAVGNVQIPLLCANQLINPGDVIVADDDGVVVVPRLEAEEVVTVAKRRLEIEVGKRAMLAAGTLGLDMYNMREPLAAKGLRYEGREL